MSEQLNGNATDALEGLMQAMLALFIAIAAAIAVGGKALCDALVAARAARQKVIEENAERYR